MKIEKEENIDSLIRWQDYAINQMTFAINMLLGLSLAILGFLISLLKDKEFSPICNSKLFLSFGIILLLLSLVTGTIVTLIRLIDFRLTRKINKIKLNNEGSEELKDLRKKTSCLDKITWFLFWIQFFSFLIGLLNSSISLFIIYHSKLL